MKQEASKYQDLGLLLLRIGIGVMFMYHGYPKIMGGVAGWAKLGAAMQYVGIGFAPVFWGFMAAASEFVGGMLLIAGLLFRPTCLLLVITMGVAVAMKLSVGAGLAGAAHALEIGIVFLSLVLIGPGKLSLDAKFPCKLGCNTFSVK
ncbi:MAG: DoxX family protein [Negativicutes bacterium]|nr:DoxX family protein [Negativicutes bacterium]